jgi:hypothetical protein
MDKLQKYRKIRNRLEAAASIISIIIGIGISTYFGIYGKKFISLDTALSFAIIVGVSIILGNIAIRIADKWYDKNKNE